VARVTVRALAPHLPEGLARRVHAAAREDPRMTPPAPVMMPSGPAPFLIECPGFTILTDSSVIHRHGQTW
jgi:hypothetical protein